MSRTTVSRILADTCEKCLETESEMSEMYDAAPRSEKRLVENQRILLRTLEHS